MLVLARKARESIVIPSLDIRLVVIEIRGHIVRLGVEAPRDIPVHREEVWRAIEREAAADRAANESEEPTT